MCAVESLFLVALPFPYWKDALRGTFIYATPLSVAIYVTLLFLAVIVLLLLLRQNLSSRLLTGAIILALMPLLSLSLKWLAILSSRQYKSLELFHNRMGLGEEILGHIPNLIIDGGIFLAALGAFVTLWTLRRHLVESGATRTN
jgi:hypothetical protein